MSLEQNTGQRSGMRRWLKVVLALSLALNLVVIGVSAGTAWRFHGGEHERGGPSVLGRFILSDIGGKEIRRLVKDQTGDRGSARERRRAEMEQMIILVQADPLDTAAVKAIVEGHILENNSFMRAVAQAWEQRLEGLSLTERRHLAERMQHGLDHRRKHGKGADRD